MRLGIIYTAFESDDLVDSSLIPWLFRENVMVSAVSYPFQNFDFDLKNNQKTVKKITELQKVDKKLHLSTGQIALQEKDARNIGLYPLMCAGVDFVMLVDSDEIYSNTEINNIIKFLEQDPEKHATWWRINFRNLVFDNNTWYGGFDPARIFRVTNFEGYSIKLFYSDNDIVYIKDAFKKDQSEKLDKEFNFSVLSNDIAFPLHHTWNNKQRSIKKINYHINHFGGGNPNACSFKWNYDLDKLEINEDYYKWTKKQKPIFNKINI